MEISEKALKKMKNKYSRVGGLKKPKSVDLPHDDWADAMVAKEILEMKVREHEEYMYKLQLMKYHINGVLAMEKVLKNTKPPEDIPEDILEIEKFFTGTEPGEANDV